MIVPPATEARLRTMYLIAHRVPFQFNGQTIIYDSQEEIKAVVFDEGTKPTGRIALDVDTGREAFEVIKENGESVFIINLGRRR